MGRSRVVFWCFVCWVILINMLCKDWNVVVKWWKFSLVSLFWFSLFWINLSCFRIVVVKVFVIVNWLEWLKLLNCLGNNILFIVWKNGRILWCNEFKRLWMVLKFCLWNYCCIFCCFVVNFVGFEGWVEVLVLEVCGVVGVVLEVVILLVIVSLVIDSLVLFGEVRFFV